jgi:hypothetical protein
MALPGFSAEGSADGTMKSPRAGWGGYQSGQAGRQIVLAIAREGAPGLEGCMERCVDRGNTRAQCRAGCLAAGGGGAGPGAGTPSTDQAVDHDICVGACWTWWSACMLDFAAIGYGAGALFEAGRELAGLAAVGAGAIGGEPCGFVRDQCLRACSFLTSWCDAVVPLGVELVAVEVDRLELGV